jgi:hypothetical protein
MLFVNVLLAFVPALTVWLIGSSVLASFVYRTETRRPDFAERKAWQAIETALVFGLFAGCVGLWIVLTYLLQLVNK